MLATTKRGGRDNGDLPILWLEAVVTITSGNKFTYNYPALECRYFQSFRRLG